MIHQVSSGSWGAAQAAATVSISDNTAYTIRAQVKQGNIFAQLVGQSASIQSSAALTVGRGEPGVYSDKTSVKFDDLGKPGENRGKPGETGGKPGQSPIY